MNAETRQTVVVDGLALANEIRDELSEAVNRHVQAGRRAPRLAVVLVGDDPASASYIKGKQRACSRVGMDSEEHDLPGSASQQEIIDVVERLNADDRVDGILVQLPLPKGVDANAVTGAIDPEKDVDGLHAVNAGRLLLGLPCLTACTPLGIMKILECHKIPLEGAQAVVIGRSNIVGKPVSLLLQQKNATVTMCHSRTRDLRAECRRADVLVAAVGVPMLVKRDWVKPGAAVIDVGVSVVDGKLTGDVDTDAVQGVASIVTPHRRGVGPMTITMLLENTLQAYENRTGV
ncbi:MAG: bifunctional methylenetetrahydrofolate dehydrogenase/methenyltetrahydrofolate cyclohydrolase FolD [Myxococcales bacterium]|nr:bifunctional methylenetetrahydrofolate dehydrogenase/methenyltetrahydrofolate cyclohydrolase FolD [Myxococcales bacterium]MDH5307686.1 bifunctional methylenetetrahydrofolate dehydrogenase/methenyltetrahydrofolate cyclohydrolase FolD [Myxococcales bacterium]MDH5567614.1 bifunctional methylenetetrahydrofolate dehydrogenase/methenyltetrahydrofolate cyclohydrolase FolD [Myxococcales bacterium]